MDEKAFFKYAHALFSPGHASAEWAVLQRQSSFVNASSSGPQGPQGASCC